MACLLSFSLVWENDFFVGLISMDRMYVGCEWRRREKNIVDIEQGDFFWLYNIYNMPAKGHYLHENFAKKNVFLIVQYKGLYIIIIIH